jgi:hypothetical protein
VKPIAARPAYDARKIRTSFRNPCKVVPQREADENQVTHLDDLRDLQYILQLKQKLIFTLHLNIDKVMQ